MLTTVIGAYPKPQYLNIPDWFRSAEGTDNATPTKDWLQAVESLGNEAEEIICKACKEVIEEQTKVGINIPTDGEVRRENYIHYHCRHLNGIDFNNLTKKSARTGNYECWLPTITDKVSAGNSFLVREWKIAQSYTKNPVKVTIPGPMTISDTIANTYYKDLKKMGIDLAEAINCEIKRLVEAGCKYIQVDEPLFARKPKDAIEYGIDNLERCFYDCPKEIVKITHICCGYPDKLDAIDYPKAPLQSYIELAAPLNDSIIDEISIEDAHRHNQLNLFEIFSKKRIILGVIKIANSKLEIYDEVKSRVKKVTEHIDKERLILAPDCGLGFLPNQLCSDKLKVLTNVAKGF